MTITQLTYFQAACHCNSISEAAEMLHISQPSISVAIKDLEAEFGVSLFKRINKQLILTPEGDFFLSQASEILSKIDSLTMQMINMGSHVNRLCIAILPLSGSYQFPALLREFSNRYPKIQIEVRETSSKQAIKLLKNNICNLVMMVGKHPVDDDTYNSYVIRSSEMVYCVSANHPLAKRDILSIEELANEPMILLPDSFFATSELKRMFYEKGIALNVVLYTANLSLIKQLLVSAREGTFLSRELAQQYPDLVSIPFKEPIKVVNTLTWNKQQLKNSALQQFIDFVKIYYSNL